jgi:hypothetical protein
MKAADNRRKAANENELPKLKAASILLLSLEHPYR